jgi:hypothetical protein
MLFDYSIKAGMLLRRYHSRKWLTTVGTSAWANEPTVTIDSDKKNT